MADYYRLFIIGHNLEAKCDVGNAFVNRDKTFRQFACRHLRTGRLPGRQKTRDGLRLAVVLTPNLNTPAWANHRSEIKMFNQYAFLYVQTDDKIQVDHASSISKIKDYFKRVPVYTIKYSFKHTENGANDFSREMEFKTKIEKAKKKIEELFGPPLPKDSTGVSRWKTSIEHIPDADKRPDEADKKPEITTLESINEDHLEMYMKTLKNGKAKSNLVRVNVVGNQGAGKTTLVKLLQEVSIICPDINQQPTEALDVTQITSRCSDVKGNKVWERNIEGYEDELNVQRMAEAMKEVINPSSMDRSTEDLKTIQPAPFNVEDSAQSNTNECSENDLALNIDVSENANRDAYLKKIFRRIHANEPEKMYITYWDFAGQITYYSTHQAFLSPSAVYILVIDLSCDLHDIVNDRLKFRSTYLHGWSVAESIQFWVSSIKAYTTDSKGGTSPILIVGTHIDRLKAKGDPHIKIKEKINKKFDEIKKIIGMSDVECTAIDNTCPSKEDLQAIQDRVLDLGLGVKDVKISAQWIDLERKIHEEKKKGTEILTFDELRDLDKELNIPIDDVDRLEAFLGHLHCRGQLMYFPHYELKNIIILQPEVLAKFLNSLMRKPVENKGRKPKNVAIIYNHDGIINSAYIEEAITRMPCLNQHTSHLIELLTFLSIIHPYELEPINQEKWYLMPCLLSNRPEPEHDRSNPSQSLLFQVEFPNDSMSCTFFYPLLVRLLKDWRPTEPQTGKPELYNNYACLKLGAATRELKIKWEKAHLMIDIRNFSKRNKLTGEDFSHYIEKVKGDIAKLCRIYSTNPRYEIKVECPTHKNSFISYDELRTNGESMCYSTVGRHVVDVSKVFTPTSEKSTVSNERPTEKDLGRLARILTDSAATLAVRLNLNLGNVKADDAIRASHYASHQRFQILIDKQRECPSTTLRALLELLTRTGEYNEKTLIEKMRATPERNTYDEIPDKDLDRTDGIPLKAIKAAMECVGSAYLFLALELGLSFAEIETCRVDSYNNSRMIVHKLLQTWRRNSDAPTIRTLLDTASFVGVNTAPILGKVGSHTQQCVVF